MSEVRPGKPPIENLEGKSEQTKRARFKRKPNAVPRFTKGKPLELSIYLREQTLEQLASNMERLRYNIKYIAHKRHTNVTQLCRELHEVGIRVSRKGITIGGNKRSVQLTYLTTMSIALRVPTWLMIHPNVESVWDDSW